MSFPHLQGWKVQKAFFLNAIGEKCLLHTQPFETKIVSNSKKIPKTNCKLVTFSTFHLIDELQAIPTSVFFQKTLLFL